MSGERGQKEGKKDRREQDAVEGRSDVVKEDNSETPWQGTDAASVEAFGCE